MEYSDITPSSICQLDCFTLLSHKNCVERNKNIFSKTKEHNQHCFGERNDITSNIMNMQHVQK